MTAIPVLPRFDSSLALLADPYRFISTACRRQGSDIFQTRLLLAKTICVTGRDAAELFYGSPHVIRAGAAPARIRKTLVGTGGVQGLDGEEHHRRKAMFLALIGPERAHEVVAAVAAGLSAAAPRWRGRTELYGAMRGVLMRAVCAWAGVPLAESEAPQRTAEVAALFEHAGAIGPKHWWARLARRRCERWMADLIVAVRNGRLVVSAGSALEVIANHREGSSKLLSPRVAAVELLNIVRPTVAVAVYAVMVAHALHAYPQSRDWAASEEPGRAECFAQEVRRFYPFFPAAIGRIAHDCTWRGHPLPGGRRILLDLYGTNHDARLWDDPEVFRPERFAGWQGDAFRLIPQGGGQHGTGHRCPGEWVALGVMKEMVQFLGRRISYRVPDQDLTIDFARLPALPRSRMVIDEVAMRS